MVGKFNVFWDRFTFLGLYEGFAEGLVTYCQVWGGDIWGHRLSLRPPSFLSTWQSLVLYLSLLLCSLVGVCFSEMLFWSFLHGCSTQASSSGVLRPESIRQDIGFTLQNSPNSLLSSLFFNPLKYFSNNWTGRNPSPFQVSSKRFVYILPFLLLSGLEF